MKNREYHGTSVSILSVTVILLVLPLMAMSCSLDASGVEVMSVSDEPGDVMRTGYVETKVGGNPELDIISLTSSESISELTIIMELAADLEQEVGYLYTITVSGIHVSYQEGELEVWRIGSELQPIDSVLTDVTGNEMTVIVKKTAIMGPFVMNGTSNRYVVDWSKGMTSESFFDLVGEVEGSRAPTVGDYTKSYSDPRGDVRLLYLDVEHVEEDGLDILGVTLQGSEDLEIVLELADAPIREDQVRYVVYLLDLRVVWSMGVAELQREGGGRTEITSEVNGSTLSMTIPSGAFSGEPGGIVVQTIRTINDDTYVQDLLPDEPYTISELLPFPPGSAREITLDVKGPDNIVMRRSYSGFSPQVERDIRGSMDQDGNGYLEAGEVEEYLSSTLESILSMHSSDLRIDGGTGELEVALYHSGLEGQVDGDERVLIGWTMNFTFEVFGNGPYELELDIDHFDPSLLPSPIMGGEEESYVVGVAVAEGWSIDPLSIEPAELANFMDIDGRSIDYQITGVQAREFDAGAIAFDLRKDEGPMDDDIDQDDDDLIWLYIVILLFMVAVIAGIILWSRREER
ncbi:MAG: hypothetical protein JW939_03025 [Candidatus Thermoplasmatota archaeon]|nr:hypothetical protein [Candidatus Thermoplasmatota archaeon]